MSPLIVRAHEWVVNAEREEHIAVDALLRFGLALAISDWPRPGVALPL